MAVLPGISRRRSRRGPITAIAAALFLLAAGVGGYLRLHRHPTPAAGANPPQAGVAMAPVVQAPLTSQQQVSGTVQYASAAAVVNEARGVTTALPAAGQVITQGQSLYSVSGRPVILLYGSVPAYRDLTLGLTGQDVQELNADLGLSPNSDLFTDATATALERFQRRVGLPATGQLLLGDALFLPSAVRVASVVPALGTAVQPGETVLQTTSSTEGVVAQVDPSIAPQLKVGDSATITFADGATAPGTIRAVAKVATSAGGQNNPPTVEVDIAPTNPSSLTSMDNASVQVSVITASVPDALAVPVTALLAQASGGYGLEVVGSNGTHTILPVKLGIFDDAAGLVQVTGPGLAPNRKVVVAGT